jgi:tRNA(Ile)-lysidine synthase
VSDLLDAGVIDELFHPFEIRSGLLVAVSGGPDSMALLLLVARWANVLRRPPVFCATVDHGLRPNARAEAVQVATWARDAGVPHAILSWDGPKPETRIQESARDARYALLETHAADVGADTLLTAHHADDQAETILFRLTRGSGVAGLAGMAREMKRGELYHARPLLDFSKADLVAVCEALGQAFVTDPSNVDPRFARTGLRALAETLEQQGLSREEILRLGARAARAEEALSASTIEWADRLASRRSTDGFSANADVLRSAPLEILLRILCREIEAITGRRPRLDRAEALTTRLRDALIRGEALSATLGGAIVALRSDAHLSLERERPRGARAAKLKETATNCRHAVHAIVKKPMSPETLRVVSLGKRGTEA